VLWHRWQSPSISTVLLQVGHDIRNLAPFVVLMQIVVRVQISWGICNRGFQGQLPLDRLWSLAKESLALVRNRDLFEWSDKSCDWPSAKQFHLKD